MEPCAYNHVVTVMVGDVLITDNPISRMGQPMTSDSVATVVISSHNKTFQYIFPYHAQLLQSATVAHHPLRVVHYGDLVGLGEFGLTLPADDARYIFCLTLQYDKMADPFYQQAVVRAIVRVATAARLCVNADIFQNLCTLLSMQTITGIYYPLTHTVNV